jgi:hypothetical protein
LINEDFHHQKTRKNWITINIIFELARCLAHAIHIFELSTYLSTNVLTQQNTLLIVGNNLFFFLLVKFCHRVKFQNSKFSNIKVILEGFHHQKWEKKLVIYIIFEPWRCSIDMIHTHYLPIYPPTQQTHYC